MGCVKPMVRLLPFKANTAKQSHGAGRGRAGRLTAGLAPSVPSSNKPDTKEAASDNTNSTMIGSDGSQSAAKSGGVIIDCFFCSPVLIEGGEFDWRKMWRGGKITGGGVQTKQHKKKYKYNLICSKRGREIFTYIK